VESAEFKYTFRHESVTVIELEGSWLKPFSAQLQVSKEDGMIDLTNLEAWFVTGSQHLYDRKPETG